MAKSEQIKNFHSGHVKKRILVNVSRKKAWRKISNIIGLPEWINEIIHATHLSKTKRGVGGIRKLTFNDGNVIEEHIVSWQSGESLSYVATSGLPLRIYHATLSIKSKNKNSVYINWESYLNSKKMTKKQFDEFHSYLTIFYQKSLRNLKKVLEK